MIRLSLVRFFWLAGTLTTVSLAAHSQHPWEAHTDRVTGLEIRSPRVFRPLGITSFDGPVILRLIRPSSTERSGGWRRESEIWLVDWGTRSDSPNAVAEDFDRLFPVQLAGWRVVSREEVGGNVEIELARAGARGWAWLGRVGDRRIAVIGLSDAESFEVDRAVFVRAAASSRIRKQKGAPEESLRRAYAARSDWLDVERRLQLCLRAPPGWSVVESPRFLVIHPEGAPSWIEESPLRLEAVRSALERRFPPRVAIRSVGVVRVCNDRVDYFAHGGVPDAAGVWNRRTEELVLFLDPQAVVSGDRRFLTLQHEAVHQYFAAALGDKRPASWFDEGVADTFAAARFDDEDRVVFEKNSQRLPRLEIVLRRLGPLPLRELLNASHGEYLRGGAATYATGWSFVYFLMTSPEVSAHEEWARLLDRYYRFFEQSESEALDPSSRREAALQAALGSIDIEALESAWRSFLDRLMG